MTGWLVRTFVPDSENVGDPQVRTRYGLVASIVCIACNVALCLAKGAVGIATGSVSVVADAVNNLSDASSNVVSLLGFKLASKPADEDHPYGHGRFEYLAGLAVAILVTAIGVNLLMESVAKIASPEATEFGVATVVALVASMLVKLWMAAFNRTLGRKISSETLAATAADSRNDVITSAAVLAAAIVSAATGVDLDGWTGLAVGIFICWSGFGLVKDAVSPLLGRVPDPVLIDQIRSKILSYPGVLGTHDLMVHDYGPGRQFASAHVEMAGEEDPFAAHDTLDNIEQDFKRDMGLVMTLHYDPIVTDDPELDRMHVRVEQLLHTYDIRLGVHDFRMVPGKGHVNLIFDVVLPTDLRGQEADITAALEKALNQNSGVTYYPVITFDQSGFN